MVTGIFNVHDGLIMRYFTDTIWEFSVNIPTLSTLPQTLEGESGGEGGPDLVSCLRTLWILANTEGLYPAPHGEV